MGVEVDSDQDGLPDAFERLAGLDPRSADSDGDGELDADEDPDEDGLSNLEEFALAADSIPSDAPPNPLQRSLLIELDAAVGRLPDESTLARVAQIYQAAGLGVHFIVDEDAIAVGALSGGFQQRHELLSSHRSFPSRLHVMVLTEREDLPQRGGEAVTDGDGDVDRAGVIIYRDALDALHPACGGATAPITANEALAGTLAHELGHALQLGHDTPVGGGINPFNLMSVPQSCAAARQRLRGEGNDDRALGSVQSEGVPGLSAAAIALIRWDRRLSIETATLLDEDGQEM